MKLAIPIRFRHGSALLIILACLTLVTVLVVSLLMISQFERKASGLALSRAQTETFADYAADLAIGRLREAIDSGRTFKAGSGYSMWASEPGRIHVVNVDTNGIMTPSSRDMFSALPGADDDKVPDHQNVDLNKLGASGSHSITGSQPGTMKLGWINLLADPNQPASKNNPIVGRMAYWVDDESCKVNVNTADGSQKYATNSFGFGTPSEISLQALPSGDAPTTGEDMSRLSQIQAAAISKYAWDSGFNTVKEVARVTGIPKSFYETNKFNLTAFSEAPELTFFGEPRIYLFPTADTTSPYDGYVRSANSGAYIAYDPESSTYAFSGPGNKARTSDYLDFVYPTSLQLPQMKVVDSKLEPLLQFTPVFTGGTLPIAKSNLNYHFAARIAKAIKGVTSQGQTFAWPAFANLTSGGFDEKYNDRQIDSIALNIIDVATIVPSSNQNRIGYNFPAIVAKGMLSGEMVMGMARAPKLTEAVFNIDSTERSDPWWVKPPPPADQTAVAPKLKGVQIDMELEFYMPVYFAGDPVSCQDFRLGNEGSYAQNGINQNDHRGEWYSEVKDSKGKVIDYINGDLPSAMGGYWNDKLLSFRDSANPAKLAGVDLRGHARYWPDLEKDDKPATYHPFANGKGGSSYNGAPTTLTPKPARFSAPLTALSITGGNTPPLWQPGRYFNNTSTSGGANFLFYDQTQGDLILKGGATVWARNGSSSGCGWESVPLDSFRNSQVTNEDPANIVEKLQQAVIPVPENFVIEQGTTGNMWHARVADPLVNKFPGDWIIETYYSPLTRPKNITLLSTASVSQSWGKPTAGNPNGSNNPELLPQNGGDPLSLWLPKQHIDFPKQSRFPSIGALNYIRTGIIPDDLDPDRAPLPKQKGTPWRSINLAASSSPGQSITVAGTTTSYPDWAMLDLFTVPFTPQLPFQVGQTPTPRRILTHGGATEGKLNINNPLIPYPFSLSVANVSQSPPERTAPLEALFWGIKTSTSYQPTSTANAGFTPEYTTVDAQKAVNLRRAIQTYLNNNGPFLLSGQLAEVPEINAYTYTGVDPNAQSRNDLMREVVGATTTQSNVFSIWVVTQTIKKKPGNPNPGIFEPGDVITGETRRCYLVERYIETGLDGIPGNASALQVSTTAPSYNDGVRGTADDPIDPRYHPAFSEYPLPYRWRILSVTNSAS